MLQEAEEDIARGVRKLALLVADSSVHDKLTTEFKQYGMSHPYVSHVGFRVRSDPTEHRKLMRFMSNRSNKIRSLTDMQNSLWMYLKQFTPEL